MRNGGGVRGDFRKLRALMQGVDTLQKRPFLRAVVQGMGAQALALSLKTFQQSKDPYDERWQPLKRRKGQPLLDTGRLRNSISYRASGTSFSLVASARYAGFHQGGGSVHTKARFQPVTKAGRFKRRSASRGKATAVRHVSGAGFNVPARPFFPTAKGLPPGWARELETIAKDALLKAVPR